MRSTKASGPTDICVRAAIRLKRERRRFSETLSGTSCWGYLRATNMQFGLSESQRILQSNARKFFAAECPISEVRRILETDTAQDQKLWRSMAEQGFLGVVFPEDAGGMGLGFVELAALAEEMGRALVPGAFLSNLFAGAILEASGATKHLAAIATGEKTATVALLESSASWDPNAIQMPTLAGEK